MTESGVKLFEKIIRAKVALEYKVEHAPWCHVEDITGHPAPCNCAAEVRAKDQAIARCKAILGS